MSSVGLTHNVSIVGSGETTVVLSHGYGTDQSVWKLLVPHLMDDYKVLLYDNMGAGTTNPDHFDFELPCHIIQSSKDYMVPVAVGEYLRKNLGGPSVVEVMPTEGHLPHLSAPEVTIPVVLRHIRQDISVNWVKI
ncbi:Probable esterase KAI2 [Striga hermonthica]|uniref:Probable esterase KAI2 n=1 Tax=Striga hermonthica TaxID=68872 RepID=A0A9N7RKN9_STRHE|nr:Probable esterase KAI2 [Striga hermonthica]